MARHAVREPRRREVVAVAVLGSLVLAVTILVGVAIFHGRPSVAGTTQLIQISKTSDDSTAVPFADTAGQ
jgi:hypothetical protein